MEEKISQLEDRTIENSQYKQHRKKMKINKQSTKELWKYNKDLRNLFHDILRRRKKGEGKKFSEK